MTGYTFAEKALARAAGSSSARAGDVLDVRPDLIFSHDNTAAIRRIFDQIVGDAGSTALARPDRMVFTLDHAVPAPTTAHAQNHAEIRAFVAQTGIRHFYEVGRGICHQVISEDALILPGETIFGADSHTPHFGWLGAFGMGVGRTEMAALWATGELWLRVPEAIQIRLDGQLQRGVTAKDIALKILADLTVGGGAYRSIEFIGDAISTLPLDDRPVIPNMMAEFGAMNAYFPPDQVVFDYLEAKRTRDYLPLYPDTDAHYDERHTLDVSTLDPLVALPHQPDNVISVTDAAGQPIQQAYIGTCTGARYADLAAAAQIVGGRQTRVRLIIVPASRAVVAEAARTGVLSVLIDAGASIGVPGCGACMGNHLGVPASGEATISTGSRNFRGRMGTADAPIYLANPYVVAASALEGQIAHPAPYL
ncbi:MAG: aconitase/3-isopropylmalate dehydratase large subunit family protein [Chloroflexota bacterium]|nr:aconitase/3-isopropylmalate dehydratase large subunit family protein [Chloroflexota bacterium]